MTILADHLQLTSLVIQFAYLLVSIIINDRDHKECRLLKHIKDLLLLTNVVVQQVHDSVHCHLYASQFS